MTMNRLRKLWRVLTRPWRALEIHVYIDPVDDESERAAEALKRAESHFAAARAWRLGSDSGGGEPA